MLSDRKCCFLSHSVTLAILSCFAAAGSTHALEPIKAQSAARGGSLNLSNGVVGDGGWDIDVEAGGNSTNANLDPLGPIASTDVVFGFDTYIDIGADGNAFTIDDSPSNPSVPVFGANNTVTSNGQFAGTNGVISWNATARVPPGTQTYQVTLNFSSPQAFGSVRLINYLDEDVLGAGDDKLIVLNSPTSPNFQLLTIDDTDGVGIAHTAAFQGNTNATYVGWAASRFSNLRSDIEGSTGARYSIEGVINPDDFALTSDSRFPFSRVYGPADATAAFAFDLNPAATVASVTFGLGGVPNVQNDAIFRNGFEN
jgi:hypothetical protein